MKKDILAVCLVFLLALVLGVFLMNQLPFGYTDCALLYLSAVTAASAFWVGRKK